jgi:triosephosphate isomerase
VDGVLVGAASTTPASLAAIVREVHASTHHGNH